MNEVALNRNRICINKMKSNQRDPQLTKMVKQWESRSVFFSFLLAVLSIKNKCVSIKRVFV